MANRRTTFDKLQRERARKAKAAAKRDRRLERGEATDATGHEGTVLDDDSELSAPRLLEMIEQIHRQLEAKQIDHEEFEEKKAELLARLPID